MACEYRLLAEEERPLGHSGRGAMEVGAMGSEGRVVGQEVIDSRVGKTRGQMRIGRKRMIQRKRSLILQRSPMKPTLALNPQKIN